jgi:hypothetical protein
MTMTRAVLKRLMGVALGLAFTFASVQNYLVHADCTSDASQRCDGDDQGGQYASESSDAGGSLFSGIARGIGDAISWLWKLVYGVTITVDPAGTPVGMVRPDEFDDRPAIVIGPRNDPITGTIAQPLN